ncbi:hypothetical protein PR048_027053 [Dryococelus australis]|uniref:PiggyBac transposable element-derived protein domain-containing protein n=1 Tax=Dryococelus australis TaxID=614101 RepID=A0ABQ9GEC8_9NEOP|nr:hypothetical protein PR048_027053 [Dryococelus australis]
MMKLVILASSYVNVTSLSTIKRFCKQTHSKVDVPWPQIVKYYNAHMGDVDLSDMLVALYCTTIKNHRWYIGIFSQLLDICINNAWLYYRRQHSLCKSQAKPDSLKEFRRKIAENLMLCKRSKRGRPPVNTAPSAKKCKKPIVPKPGPDEQFNNVDQLPIHTSRGRCWLPEGYYICHVPYM